MRRLFPLLLVAWLAAPAAGHAQSPESLAALGELAVDDADKREAAVVALGSTRDPRWLEFLGALRDGNVYARTPGKVVDVVVGGTKSTKGDQDVIDIAAAYDRKPLGTVPLSSLTEIAADRRLRIAIKPFLDADETRAQLASPDAEARRGAAVKLGHQADAGAAPVVEAAIAKETSALVRHALQEALAMIRLAHGDPSARVLAAQTLGGLHSFDAVPALQKLAADAAASPAEREAATGAIRQIQRWGLFITTLETIFQGASLASILLLMSVGLAIVFGLMGVINMAHGELMALGAYSTFVVQNIFRARWPQYFDAYFVVALPVAFLVAAAVGVVLERGVIRRLYGRPLETLLLTWGASLIIQQGLRLWFGAANVDVSSPRWLSGGFALMTGLTLPFNRLFIIGLAAVSVAGMYWLLFRTNRGLTIRAVTQNRSMSACLGVRAGVVDALTFGLGAGLAGLAGCALTQIGNVGPSLGQNYIVDSFMVVVTGGVGKLAGTILAAAGIGGLNKGIEPALGAVFAKVAILLAVIIFLQRRPAGLFAPRGRNAEA
ncbi:MAG TPA: urea ABC transporter permease subunit UrtB [Methylomirabilota bacterium]|jgi:urea transport system permease protein|nr:urea ABC transporter permease subunit UrtB [Methylomirabilota bacterium]